MSDRYSKFILTVIALLLLAHLVKGEPAPAFAKSDVQKVMIVGVDRKVGAQWDALNCGGTSEWTNE